MTTFYNENNKHAAQWLRNLAAGGHISDGVVDERSIKELHGSDLDGYKRVHLFAGIGGWDLALKLAGWGDAEVWTGSCPCQPFSTAGKRQGVADDRHLWPDMFRLIRERRPAAIFGEQVASAIGHGWLDGVFADLEGEGYACGAAVLGAHSVGAPHIRQRLWWVADSKRSGVWTGGRGQDGSEASGGEGEDRERQRVRADAEPVVRGLAVAQGQGRARVEPELQPVVGEWTRPGSDGPTVRLGDAESDGWVARRTQSNGWSVECERILCGDGKTRRIEPGLGPLVDGFPGRVGLLRGYGNAIVPQVAAEFIAAFMEATCQPH